MAATISPRELSELQAAGKNFELIDVREPAEYEDVHIAFAKNIPLENLDPALLLASRKPGSTPLYIICQSGARAGWACKQLAEAGLDTINVDGGTAAWAAAGLPVVRGLKKPVSLERQVRIAAGALVVTGSALAYFVNTAWIALAGFVGAGLVFAGVTGTCGLAMLLAKMPWNRHS